MKLTTSVNFSVWSFFYLCIHVVVLTATPDEDSSVEVYPLFHQIPQSKVLTFYKKESFTLESIYSEGQTIPHPSKVLGK